MNLHGIDGYNWFACGADWQDGIHVKRGWKKWTINQPMLAGQFPAGAIIARKQLLQQAPAVVIEHRNLNDVLSGKPAAITEGESFDPNRDLGSADQAATGHIDPLAFASGPVEVVLHEQDAPQHSIQQLERQTGFIHSSTNEIQWHYAKGYVHIEAPQVIAAVGFLKELGSIRFQHGVIDCKNEYAAVTVVALDDRPLNESQRVLIQIGTETKPSNWQTKTHTFQTKNKKETYNGERILKGGTSPWQVTNNQCAITLQNSVLNRVQLLDSQLRLLRNVNCEQVNGTFTCTLPTDGLHLIIDRK